MTEESVDSISKQCLISNDPETIGFDLSSGTKWIYPENYPRRDYQFTIVQTALYSNTLVCLPTGLGKTFIAAVIMFNFWRWYPRGRIVFLAPTKPLVAQQIQACNEIMGIPIEETVELTGAINQNKRKQAWTQKRVIFATPQTFQKDLQNNYVPYELIKCIVFDEAHKALGKHSYSEIMNLMNKNSKFFRVLALSATPGSKIDQVREVIQNLHISELELRDDSSEDIIPYTNDRTIEKVIVCLNEELNEYKERYINIMDRHVRVLMKFKILRGELTNISKGKIFMLRKQYETKARKGNNHGIIMKTLNILITMYHAYELLLKHGLRAFYNFYSNHSEKFWFESELDLQLLLENIKNYIGYLPEVDPLNDTNLNIPEDIIFGHSKFYKLSDIVEEHFKSFSQQGKSTRVIVFVEYRDIVNEIYILLLQKRPLIRPQMFVGRAGQNQKQQVTALEDFRNDKVNVLISTSVGEEGLDVGEVDLIVCFDISTSTPIRLVQRMGRTGRKRNGRVVVLLTAGKEEETFFQALSKKNSLTNKVLESSNISSSLYESSPRMIPANITPECLPIFIKVQPQTTVSKKTKQTVQRNTRGRKKAVVASDENSAALPSKSKKDLKTKNLENTQSTMMKFLTDQQKLISNNCDSDSGILSEEFQVNDIKTNAAENPYVNLKPKDVKLLTCDALALEFLTLCTMKKSEEETSDPNILKLDMSLFPVDSGINELPDIDIPSLDILDCIKDLTPYIAPIESENVSLSYESVVSFPYHDKNDRYTQENCTIVESKYVQESKNMNLEEEEKIGLNESDFFNDITIFEPKCKDNQETVDSNKENIEILTSNLFNDSFSFNLNDSQSENPNKIDSKEQNNVDSCKNDSFKEPRKLTQEKLPHSNASIEVDFQDILDEGTESEPSESQPLISMNQFNDAHNFDALLDEDSTDDDIFSEEQSNITVASNNQNNTITNSPKLLAKRSASSSPCQESANKKQKTLGAEATDSDSTIIFGTPPQIKETWPSFTFSSNESIEKLIHENANPDSDQDMFDDLDFETQCTFTSNANNQKDEETKNIPPVKVTDRVNLSHEKVMHENKIISENVNKSNDSSLKVFNLVKYNVSLHDIETRDKTKDKRSLKDEKTESHSNKKVRSIDEIDFDFDDWNDDFEFSPPKNTTNNEKRNNSFISKNVNSNNRASQTKEHSSPGWISTDFKKKIKQDQPTIFRYFSSTTKTIDFTKQTSKEQPKLTSDFSYSCKTIDFTRDTRKESPKIIRDFSSSSKKVDFIKQTRKETPKIIRDFSSSCKKTDFIKQTRKEAPKIIRNFSSSCKIIDFTTETTKEQPKIISNFSSSTIDLTTREKEEPPKIIRDFPSSSKTIDLTIKETREKEEPKTMHDFSSSSKTIDLTKEITKKQSKIIRNFSSSCKTIDFTKNLNDATTISLPDEEKSSVNFKKFQSRNVVQPKLRLFSLKKNFQESIKKDRSNFLVPQSDMNPSSELKTNELAAANAPEKKCNNKENKLPSSRDCNEREANVHPESQKNTCNKKVRRKVSNFIEDEVEVSSDNETSEGSSGEDADLTNFVSYTQEPSDAVDMKAHYLRTLNKSPVAAGAFMFKPLQNLVPDSEIFSQPASQVDNTYVNDSFCIENEANIVDIASNDDSVLENMECNLGNRRSVIRRKNRLKFKDLEDFKKQRNCKKSLNFRRFSDNSSNSSSGKNSSSSSSSEDETEILRKQVLEESKLLKQMER